MTGPTMPEQGVTFLLKLGSIKYMVDMRKFPTMLKYVQSYTHTGRAEIILFAASEIRILR